MRVYIDVDDVLADTTRALLRLAAAEFSRAVAYETMEAFDLRISLGLDDEEHARFMHSAHQEPFLLGLPALGGAADVVAEWRRGGADVDIVTGRPPEARDATHRWLADNGIDHDGLHIVDKYGRFPGAGALTPHDLIDRGYDLIIEDSLEVAELMVEATDARVLLVDRPWNRRTRVLRRVHSWEEIRGAALE